MDVRAAVERHLVAAFGPVGGRAGVTFLGAEPIDVLRFGPRPDGFFRYATVGMSAEPMSDPAAAVRDPAGPRAELVLSLRVPRDSVARQLALLAAIPSIEGVPVIAGAGLDLGEPLWDEAPFHGVLVGEPGGLVPDLLLADAAGSPTSGQASPIDDPAGIDDAAQAPGFAHPTEFPAPVRFLPVFPMTPNESAYKRVHGAAALRERWLAAEMDLRDPLRRGLRI
ncbi:suppressor of fused domain protein [Pseudofrankia asymbiotica]|uniref:Suppressor of fused protein (SUFU) n=1 Tax=Pseudofrankia asymbiotica TaxID=1834516 RepID=A0A1V2IKX7_9ACTN|nr:suppressor of fused domain protein [Pseudofrankia asymbiotica]ONH33844.1 Suppressor of fused protein (SUFU) [Pseudofrankia asymbiotica]